MTEQNRLLTPKEVEDLVYPPSDKLACCLATMVLQDAKTKPIIEKQAREMTLKEVEEWLDTKWVSYGTFAFIKLSDEEMKLLKQGKLPGGS